MDTFAKLDSVLMLSSVNLPGGELVCIYIESHLQIILFGFCFDCVSHHPNIQCLQNRVVIVCRHVLLTDTFFVL